MMICLLSLSPQTFAYELQIQGSSIDLQQLCWASVSFVLNSGSCSVLKTVQAHRSHHAHHHLNHLSQEAVVLVSLDLKIETVINPVSNWKFSSKSN